MRRILSWYKFHLLRSFEFDRAWPWKKVYWTEMGKDDEKYEEEHGTATLMPWRKVFWLTPHMKRFYSILIVIIGFHAFLMGLILLVFALERVAMFLLIQGIFGNVG